MDLKRTLQSLACGKQKLLKKNPAGAEVNESDTFYFNDDFTNPRYQVRIDSIQAKETVRGIILCEGFLNESGWVLARGNQAYRSLDRSRPETGTRRCYRPDNEGEEEIDFRTDQDRGHRRREAAIRTGGQTYQTAGGLFGRE
jgi:hypothetical protein